MLRSPSRVFLFASCVAAAAFARDLSEEIVLTPQGGSAREDLEIARWQDAAREAPAQSSATAQTFERLGWAFIAKARRTQDAGFYKLAEKTADVLEEKFGPSDASRLLRGHVLHNLHRFAEAEALARQLVAHRGAPADLALLSDALMEQGKLADAIAVLQQLADRQPGCEALTRIAHVRWLKGDLAGAIAAMDAARHAADPRDQETAAWILVRLAGYHLQAGDAKRALAFLDAADGHAPDYAPAGLVRGRVLLALGRNTEAVAALARAAALNPLPEYQWWLADALRTEGRTADADRLEVTLRARGAAADPRTLALFLATRGEQPAVALRLAREELARRADVLTRDALAWALLAHGEPAAAAGAMHAALAEHTRDARLFFHAGEIALANGELAAAQRHFADAQALAATLTPSERALLATRLIGRGLASAR